MEIVKDVALRLVQVHDGTPGPHHPLFESGLCADCPWGEMREATFIVNGFPHKRILRFSPARLRRDVTAWLSGVAI